MFSGVLGLCTHTDAFSLVKRKQTIACDKPKTKQTENLRKAGVATPIRAANCLVMLPQLLAKIGFVHGRFQQLQATVTRRTPAALVA